MPPDVPTACPPVPLTSPAGRDGTPRTRARGTQKTEVVRARAQRATRLGIFGLALIPTRRAWALGGGHARGHACDGSHSYRHLGCAKDRSHIGRPFCPSCCGAARRHHWQASREAVLYVPGKAWLSAVSRWEARSAVEGPVGDTNPAGCGAAPGKNSTDQADCARFIWHR